MLNTHLPDRDDAALFRRARHEVQTMGRIGGLTSARLEALGTWVAALELRLIDECKD